MTPPDHPSLWVREAAALDNAPGPAPKTAEVVVLGAGIAGVCAALHLARAGVRPVVLEAGTVASRASGRNDGQVLLGLGEHYNRIVGQFGPDTARVLWGFIRDNNRGLRDDLRNHGVACDLIEAGGLRLAETEHEANELAEAAALLKAEGIDHRLLTPAELSNEFPAAQGFHGGMILPGEACVQPAAMTRGLARLAAQNGATFHEHTPVAAVEGELGAFRVRCVDGHVVEAAAVVHCTSALGHDADPSGFLQRQVFPFRGQILATNPLPAAIQKQFVPYSMSSNFCYEYFRMHQGRFVVGGMRWNVKGEELGITDDTIHNEEVSQRLQEYVARHFPILDGHGFPNCWTGIMAGTKDGLPLVGPIPGRPGAFAYLGFNGYGLSFAWLGGKVLADWVVDGTPAHAAGPLFTPRRLELD